MSDARRILGCVLLWTATVTGLHFSLNVDWPRIMNDRLPDEQRKLNLAYIPVT